MKKLSQVLLASAAIGALAFPMSQAEAMELLFRPGQATGGVSANNMGVVASVEANLDDGEIADEYNWSSVNDNITNTDPPIGAPFTSANQWLINVDKTGGASATAADDGDTFTESFTFHLLDVQDGGGTSTGTYGQTGFVTLDDAQDVQFPSHVFMEMTLSGELVQDFGGTAGTLGLQYNSAAFFMYFDEDGNPNDGDTTDQHLIAVFGSVGNPTFTPPGISDPSPGTNQATLQWTVNFDEALCGVFLFPDSLDDVSSCLGDGANETQPGSGIDLSLVSNPLAPSLFKISRQDITVRDSDVNDGVGTIQGILVESQSNATGTSVINAIPEPLTLGLLGAGLVGLGAAARRRRSA